MHQKQKNKILDRYIEMQEVTDIKVSLENWLELTKTPIEVREQVCELIRNDIEKGEVTGFSPYFVDKDIYFTHHWVYNIGIK